MSQFNVTYSPRAAIKGQALVNFLVECTLPAVETPSAIPSQTSSHLPKFWELFVDGSLTVDRSGVGVLLISPDKFKIQLSIEFGFLATNNCSKYEPLIIGLRLAEALQV